MAATLKPIRCKSCTRILATVSETGLVPATTPDTQGCNTCQQFSTLYDAMRAADDELEPLLEKGEKHRGKQTAVANVNRTHMDFDNWLIGVEAPVMQNKDGEEAPEQDDKMKVGEKSQYQGIKRARSYSPTTRNSRSNGTPEEANEGQQLQQRAARLPHEPSPKRSHSMTSLPERKRIRFSDSVEFRDEYRDYLQLSRSHNEYVPGRYAPPEEGYLDTSGADQSFPKFTGLRKVRGKWVEVAENDEKGEGGRDKMLAELRSLGVSEDLLPQQEVDRNSQDDMDHNEGPPLESRTERSLRRARRSSNADAARDGGIATGQSRSVAPKDRETSLDRTVDDAQEPFGEAVTHQSTAAAEKQRREMAKDATNAMQDVEFEDLAADLMSENLRTLPTAAACDEERREADGNETNVNTTGSKHEDSAHEGGASPQVPRGTGDRAVGSEGENEEGAAEQIEFAQGGMTASDKSQAQVGPTMQAHDSVLSADNHSKKIAREDKKEGEVDA